MSAGEGIARPRDGSVVLAFDALEFLVKILQHLGADVVADLGVVGDRVAREAKARACDLLHVARADDYARTTIRRRRTAFLVFVAALHDFRHVAGGGIDRAAGAVRFE